MRTHVDGELGADVVVGGELHEVDAIVADLEPVVGAVVDPAVAGDVEVRALQRPRRDA